LPFRTFFIGIRCSSFVICLRSPLRASCFVPSTLSRPREAKPFYAVIPTTAPAAGQSTRSNPIKDLPKTATSKIQKYVLRERQNAIARSE